MKLKATLLFLLIIVSVPFFLAGQAAVFTPGPKLHGQLGNLHSATNAKGDMIVWSAPSVLSGNASYPNMNYTTQHYLTGNVLLRFGKSPEDSSSAAVVMRIEGKDPVPAFNFAFFSGKLYAFGQVWQTKTVAWIYACEINMEDLSVMSTPMKVLECENAGEAYIKKREIYDGKMNIPGIQVSDDHKRLLLYHQESPGKQGVGGTHIKVFNTQLTTIEIEKNVVAPKEVSRFYSQEIQLPDKGPVVLTAYGNYKYKYAEENNHGSLMYKYFVCLVGDSVEYEAINMTNVIGTIRTRISADGRVVCAGIYITDLMSGKGAGTFYYSLWIDKSRAAVLTLTPSDTVERHGTEELVLGSDGTAWLITQYHFAINANDKLGDFLVTAYDADGKKRLSQLIYRESKTYYSPVYYAITPIDGEMGRLFSAYTAADGLHFLFMDDKVNSCTGNSPARETNKDNNSLVQVVIQLNGHLTKTCLVQFYENDIRPTASMHFMEVDKDRFVFFCSRYEKTFVPYMGTLQVN